MKTYIPNNVWCNVEANKCRLKVFQQSGKNSWVDVIDEKIILGPLSGGYIWHIEVEPKQRGVGC